MARTPHLILGSAAPPRPAAKLRSAGPTVWPSHRQSWTGPSHDRTAGTSPPTGACWDLKSTHHYTVTLDLNQLSLHEQPFFSAVSLYASFLIWASACASWYNTWFHWFVNSHIESFPPSLALKYLLLKIFTAGQISKKKKKREITWTFTVPENKVQYHWQRVQFFIQSPKTLETTHIPFSCTFWLNPCGSNCPHMWAEQMKSKRCEIHNHKRLNRPSQTLHESILRTRSNKHPVVCFISHESDHSSGSLSASDLNMIIHVISEPLQCPLFPHFLPAGCGLLSQPVLLPSQRSGAEVPRRPSPSSCSHCLIGQIPSKGRYQLLTLQRVETLSCPDVPHSHRGVGIPGNQDVVSKLHAAGQRLVARQRVDTPTWTRDTRLA